MKNVILAWLPRFFGILIAAFLSLFASGEHFSWMEAIPAFAVLLVVFLAWENEWLGAIGFAAMGMVATFFFHTYERPLSFLIISLPFFLVSLMYLPQAKNWRQLTKTNLNHEKNIKHPLPH